MWSIEDDSPVLLQNLFDVETRAFDPQKLSEYIKNPREIIQDKKDATEDKINSEGEMAAEDKINTEGNIADRVEKKINT